jgi:adenine-specific DNA-methyltransferase
MMERAHDSAAVVQSTEGLEGLETRRIEIARQSSRAHKSALGQFFTPGSIAQWMAGLFDLSSFESVRVLDPGAGIGVLSCALLTAARRRDADVRSVTAYELDPLLIGALRMSLREHADATTSVSIHETSFIDAAARMIAAGDRPFNAVILNPPYKKIASNSHERRLASSVGVEAPNIYALFVLMSLLLLQDGGELVAIIPRSFANGTYYRAFRRRLLALASINRLHVFDSRDSAFRTDDVLQENVILHCTRGAVQGQVDVSSSHDDAFTDMASRTVPFSEIVRASDHEQYIHIPTVGESPQEALHNRAAVNTLSDIGLSVSTGPVVDFRVRSSLRMMPEAGTVPLIYPGHLSTGMLLWPDSRSRKPNAIVADDDTRGMLYPNGAYCVVRRFSSKEERRRVFASAILGAELDGQSVAFENHVNVFHIGKRGLSDNVALGLAAYLNTTVVDNQFRSFSGHTQVNATDLRWLRYPPLSLLEELGQWARVNRVPSQESLDQKYIRLLETYTPM